MLRPYLGRTHRSRTVFPVSTFRPESSGSVSAVPPPPRRHLVLQEWRSGGAGRDRRGPVRIRSPFAQRAPGGTVWGGVREPRRVIRFRAAVVFIRDRPRTGNHARRDHAPGKIRISLRLTWSESRGRAKHGNCLDHVDYPVLATTLEHLKPIVASINTLIGNCENMEATYCVGSDVDVCRMFDQYLYKLLEIYLGGLGGDKLVRIPLQIFLQLNVCEGISSVKQCRFGWHACLRSIGSIIESDPMPRPVPICRRVSSAQNSRKIRSSVEKDRPAGMRI
ncbi:hypothetical protein GEV33_008922 [Tenebrio molitor]|uniref:Uncharacterized protein n=1 Tax=Tenebrio molitor TaxID=7067 RepID=A0A8J6HFP1_TENMO|nr:hypothetical protein GEV33_008922 [Tenebrio molitor]